MSKQFSNLRRQQFLPEPYYKAMAKFLREDSAYWKTGMVAGDEREDYRRHLALMVFVSESYQLWSLRFTGGEPLDTLRDELETVIAAFEYQKKFEEKK